MKNLLVLSLLLAGVCSQAQYTPVTPLNSPPPSQEDSVVKEKKGFDPQRLVIGGSLGASFGNYTFVNVSPQVGYMFNQYITAGAGINYIYNSYKYSNGDRDNYSFAGVNLFSRVFPVRFLFLSAQPEINYSWGKIKYGNYTSEPDYKYPGEWVPAFLIGAGAVLSPGGKGGIFLSLQYDVVQNGRSPYGTVPYFNIGFGF
jgi:hypothetical protein